MAVNRHEAATTVRELPEKLPASERILWQGAPDWRSLAGRAFHVRAIALYFSILINLRGLAVLLEGGQLREALVAMLWLVPAAAFALAVLSGIAWLCARATWYTLTDRRVVMRLGIVLEITFNFPYSVIESASLREHADGCGDIPLRFVPGEQIAYLHLWPHVRPWRFQRTEPMLRCIPEPHRVAQILASGLAMSAGRPVIRLMAPAAAPGTAAGGGLAVAR